MLNYRGFSACVISDGVELKTYEEQIIGKRDETGDQRRTRACWIPSVEGAEWYIMWKNDAGEDAEIASCAHVFVDGQDVASGIMRAHRSTPMERKGAKTSTGRVKPFTFSRIQLTDDDSIADENDVRAPKIGCIRLEIKLVVLGKTVPLRPYDPEEIGIMHEKAKKAGVHATTYAPARRCFKSRGVTNAPYDPEDTQPWVTFEFKYRSMDMLKASDIIRKRSFFLDNPVIETIDLTSEEDGGQPSPPGSGSPPPFKRARTQDNFNEEMELDQPLTNPVSPLVSLPPDLDQPSTNLASSPPPDTDRPAPKPTSPPHNRNQPEMESAPSTRAEPGESLEVDVPEKSQEIESSDTSQT